jgi:UDP-N-acetylglucosamine:LPS N-acetylglucosamine transferase
MEEEDMSKKNKKICFAASSGGHYEQLLMLKPLMEKYDSFVITEKTFYKTTIKDEKMYYLHQVNRKEKTFLLEMICNAFLSLYIFIKERPDVVITTGVLAMIPMCILAKLFGKKLIFIESFAKVSSPTETGKLMYKFADQFYVQWKPMLEFYPNAIYLGGIY